MTKKVKSNESVSNESVSNESVSNKFVSNKFVSNSILVFLPVSAKLCNFAENIKRN